MIRALYTASSGLVVQSNKQDILANNIANAGTPGFKKHELVTNSFAQELDSQMSTLLSRKNLSYPDSPVNSQIVDCSDVQDNSQGPLQQTQRTLDFAIDGPGAFEVKSDNGTYTTRAGNFEVNSKGELCTVEGDLVMGESGTIMLPEGKWNVTNDGTVFAEGAAVDKIKLVGADAAKTTIRQGSLEQSNVNIVREMVDMIVNMRSYEANQKVISSVDGSLEKLLNEVGKV